MCQQQPIISLVRRSVLITLYMISISRYYHSTLFWFRLFCRYLLQIHTEKWNLMPTTFKGQAPKGHHKHDTNKRLHTVFGFETRHRVSPSTVYSGTQWRANLLSHCYGRPPSHARKAAPRKTQFSRAQCSSICACAFIAWTSRFRNTKPYRAFGQLAHMW